MLFPLASDHPTERHWIFNDASAQNYMIAIPINQRVISGNLNWKESRDGKNLPVGSYRLDLSALEAGGYIRSKKDRFILRFQRTKERIEIAINRRSNALDIGRVLIPRRPAMLNRGPGEP